MKIKRLKQTPFGTVDIVWSANQDCPRITRVILSEPDLSAESQLSANYRDLATGSCSEIDEVASDIKAVLEGEDINISIAIADLDACSAFRQSVLHAIHKVPRGHVSTYQLIATKLGNPGATRAVGNALANNPIPIIVPCHRAIRSDGSLGGYQGGMRMKRCLLAKEGLAFRDAAHIDTTDFFYLNSAPAGTKFRY